LAIAQLALAPACMPIIIQSFILWRYYDRLTSYCACITGTHVRCA